MGDLKRDAGAVGWTVADGVSRGLLQQAELWARLQRALVAQVERGCSEWLDRRRAGLDAAARALGQMYECRSLVDLAQWQQPVLAQALDRGATEASAMVGFAAALMAPIEKAARAEAVRVSSPSVQAVPETAARDTAQPERVAAE